MRTPDFMVYKTPFETLWKEHSVHNGTRLAEIFCRGRINITPAQRANHLDKLKALLLGWLKPLKRNMVLLSLPAWYRFSLSTFISICKHHAYNKCSTCLILWKMKISRIIWWHRVVTCDVYFYFYFFVDGRMIVKPLVTHIFVVIVLHNVCYLLSICCHANISVTDGLLLIRLFE